MPLCGVRACVYASLAQVFASAPVHCRTAADDSSASGSASGSASILPSSTGVAAQCAPYIQLFDFIGTSCGQDTLDILMKALSRVRASACVSRQLYLHSV
ncbi:hypothetical protein EON67_04145 [archaeon]|nr:MAG: hypothetical protein EON67_04145 [archaeon]